MYIDISQTMVFGAVFAANFFNGLNTNAWTGWVFFATFIGDALLWVYTVSFTWRSPVGQKTNDF
jgi:phospholipid-translocating ATPase